MEVRGASTHLGTKHHPFVTAGVHNISWLLFLQSNRRPVPSIPCCAGASSHEEACVSVSTTTTGALANRFLPINGTRQISRTLFNVFFLKDHSKYKVYGISKRLFLFPPSLLGSRPPLVGGHEKSAARSPEILCCPPTESQTPRFRGPSLTCAAELPSPTWACWIRSRRPPKAPGTDPATLTESVLGR